MTYYRPQDPQDAYEAEQWYADSRHFQDVTLSPSLTLSAPAPGEATGRLRNEGTLRYLGGRSIVTNVRPTVDGGWTYSVVSG
jgi:hypothetical protein